MNTSDNVVALRSFADALTANDAEDMNEPGKRSLCEFLHDAADEIETLRVKTIALRAAFHVNMVLAHPAMSHAEIDKAIDRATNEVIKEAKP